MKRTIATSILFLSALVGCKSADEPAGSGTTEKVSAALSEHPRDGEHRWGIVPLLRHSDGEHENHGRHGVPTVAADGIDRQGLLGPMLYTPGGAVMTSAANTIYYIWYGTWGTDSAKVILDDFAQSLGGSTYYGINTSYYYQPVGGGQTFIPNSISFGGEYNDAGSLTLNLASGDVSRIVQNTINQGHLPSDPNGIYLVLTASNVTEGSFCSSYCGYHSVQWIAGTPIKYGFVGYVGNCAAGCIAGQGSPNQNASADGMASVLSHEIAETVTDPVPLSGWADAAGLETGDKCRDVHDNTYTTGNGAWANTHLGTRDYYLQDLWIQGVNGMCANALTPTTLACTNGVKDGNETDVDCGGACPACALGQHCGGDNDCHASICLSGTCGSSCPDGHTDGNETDVDCGGTTCSAKCLQGKHCNAGADCDVSAYMCVLNHCTNAFCSDGARDGNESGVDCGGATCSARCGLGQGCHTSQDCAKGVCTFGYCNDYFCNDGSANGDESDVDCGGHTCGPRCALGKHCSVAADCQSGNCQVTNGVGTCAASTCTNGHHDPGERGIDCGGAMCGPCGLGSSCSTEADCYPGFCIFGQCSIIYCGDSVKDMDETDVDCGGRSCSARCQDGKQCNLDQDCANGRCVGGKCLAATCGDQHRNAGESDVDCGGALCVGCQLGKSCTYASDCAIGAGVCLFGHCSLDYCADTVKDGDETDVDCGGPNCRTKCAAGKLCTLGRDCQSLICSGGHCQ
jgi:hypothetical protein